MENQKDNVSKLYQGLLKKGYTQDELGDESKFRQRMSDADNRKMFYDYVSNRNDFVIGDYDTYESRLNESYSTPEVKGERVNNTITGGAGTQEEADAIFEENQRRVLSKYRNNPEVDNYILENIPSMFKSNNASLMDKPLGDSASLPELSDDKFQARIDVAQKNLQDPEVQKARTDAHLRGLSASVDTDLNDIEERISQRKKAVRNENWKPGKPSSRDDKGLAELRGQRSYLEGAKELIEESQKIVTAANDEKDGTFVGGVLRGVRDKAFDVDTWTMGISDLVGGLRLKKVLEDFESGKELTPAQEKLLDAAITNMATTAWFESDLGRGYKAGQVTGESLPFMLEMMVNPISASGNAMAKSLLAAGLKRFGSAATNKAVKAGTRLATDALAATGMAATTGMPGVLGETVDRLNRNYDYGFDADGNLNVTKTGDTSFGEALGRSFTTRALENQSEMIFNAFRGAGELMRGVQRYVPGGVNRFFDAVSNSKVGQLWRDIKNSPLRKEIAQAAQIGGIGEEYLEEVYNNMANVALGEMTMEEAISLDRNIDTFLGLAPTQVMFSMIGLGNLGAMRYKTRKDTERAFGKMNDEQRRKLDELQQMGQLSTNEDIRNFIRMTMADKSLTPEQRRSEIEYAYDIVKQNSINEIAEADIADNVELENQAIDAATDPQTGMYGEVNLTSQDLDGNAVVTTANVFGEKEVNGELYLLVQAEGEEEKKWVRPSQYDAASYDKRPAEEVKALNEEMIREEAAAQAELESKYAPEVLSAQMKQGVPFVVGNEQLIPFTLTPEGNGWEVEVHSIDEKGNASDKATGIRVVTNDEYRDMLQAQLDAEQAAEEQVAKETPPAPVEEVAPEVVQPEAVEEAAEVVEEQPQVEAQQGPVIPTKEDGSIDFVTYGKEGSFKELGNMYGEKMPHKVEVTAKALAEDLVKAQSALDKAQEALDNAPIGREAKAKTAFDKAQQEYDAVKRESDFWAEMDADIKAAQAEREAILNQRVEAMGEEPMSADEFIAQQLANGNVTLTSDSYKKETGYGEEERRKLMRLFRKVENGGMTVEQAAEKLVSLDNEGNGNFFDNDTQAARDALINVLGSVSTMGDVTGYIRNNRQRQAENESEGLRNEMEDAAIEAHYDSLEDYVLQKEWADVDIPFEGVSEEEKMAIFAEAAAEYENYLNQQENGQGTTEEDAEGTDDVLLEKQADNTGGTEEQQESQRTDEGTAEESEGTYAATEVELKQEEGETIVQFAERVAEENRRRPLRERAEEWSKALGIKVTFLESIDEVDARTRREIEAANAKGDTVPGWVSKKGGVFLFMPDLLDLKDVDDTYIHEVVAHVGLPQLLGKERFGELCDKVWEMMPQSEKDYYMSYPGVKNHRDAADEYIAHLAEQQKLTPEEKTIWDNIVKLFRDMLDKALNGIIGKSKITDADIANLIKASYANLKSGAERNVSGEGTRFSAKKKRALETVSTSRKKHQQTVISSADGAKILNNLDNLAEKYENDTHTKEKTFIGEVAKAIEARKQGSGSQYATFETVNGNVVTIRLADHNATVSNFDNRDENEGISIVISAKDNNGITNDGDAHIVEYFYDSIDLRRADGKPLAEIVKSIKQSLYSGEFNDTTGLAERQEVNESRFRIANKNQEIFVSNAQKAIEGIKQEKGIPQQWLAMIEKNGGLKAGEDKWLGLSDWLKGSDKKSLTKAEILDFIGENKIRIEEVKYSGAEDDIQTVGNGLADSRGIEFRDDFMDAFGLDYGEFYIADEEKAIELYNKNNEVSLELDEYGYLDEKTEERLMEWAQSISSESAFKPINSTRLNYTTEGLENKAEIALTVPTIEPWNEDDEIHFGDAGEGRAVAWIRFGETTTPNMAFINAREAVNNYIAEMRDKYNVRGGGIYDVMNEDEVRHLQELTSAEFDTRDKVERVLVIDEIQSKRHQEGRERGYKNPRVDELRKLISKNEKERDKIVPSAISIYRNNKRLGLNGAKKKHEEMVANLSDELREKYQKLRNRMFELTDEFHKVIRENQGDVPSAPFEKNWSELAFKRMLRYAAENGYDKVAWTTGAQQAERYSLSNVIDSISISKSRKEDGKYHVTSWDKETMPIGVASGNKTPEELKELFGKEIAQLLIEGVDNIEEGSDTFVLEGTALEVGGEGMKGFYDKMLPSFVNKYVKKWGTKVQDIELPNVEEAGRIMHSVDVTDSMKESVMEGQTMFRISDKGRKIQNEVDKFTSKYNSKEVVLVDSEMTDEELEDAIPYSSAERTREEIFSGYPGGYSPNTDKIYIFVDNQELDDVENTMFHENLHPMFNDTPIVEEYFENAKNVQKAAVDTLSENYGEHEAPNELFAYSVSNDMVDGTFKFVKKYLSDLSKEEFFNKIKEFGYDREKESSRRDLVSKGRGAGRLGTVENDTEPYKSKEGIRQIPDQTPIKGSGLDEGKRSANSGPETVLEEGIRGIRERAERLGDLFEQVADMGLNGVLGNKAYTSAMVDIYKALPDDVRVEVAEDALRNYGGSVAPAVSDYLNHKEANVWDKVVGIIKDSLRKVGFDVKLTANDVKYLLWRSQKPLDRNNLLDMAEDIDMRYRLKVGEYEGSPTDGGDTPGGGGTRFRVSGKLNIRDQYEATIKKGGYQAREAVQDAMLSLRRVQELIEKATGKKLRDFENAWMHENRLSSVVQAEIHEMEQKFYKPMMDAVKKLMKIAYLEQEKVADYLMLKHGIERNREMAVRKALTDSEGKIDRAKLDQWYQDKEAIRNDATLDTWRKKQEAMDNAALNYGADMSVDYSGLTSMFDTDDLADCTQRAYLEVETLEELHPAETEALGNAVKDMNQSTLDKSFESGLMNKKVYDELSKDMYDFYVPLRGFEETTSDEVYAYMDNDRNAFNAPLRRAKGRTSKSDNPIAYMKSIAESGIMQGNRNKMKQSFLNMVINNPSDLVSVKEGVWAIYNPATGEWEAASFPESLIPRNATPADVEAAYEQWEADMEQRAQNDSNVKKVREGDDVPYRVVGNKINQHQVIVKRLGKSYTLTINANPRLAMALNGQTNPNNTSNDGKVAAYVSGKIDALNRTLSAWYTTRNPDFVVSNFMRDTFYTNTIVRAKEGNEYANKYHKHYAELLVPGKMMSLFSKYENGTLDPSKEIEKNFLDFMMNGGETGYSNLKDLEHIKKKIEKELKGSRLQKVEDLLEKLDIVNRAVENTSRFAAYLTSREMGRSIAKSVFDAKEISVNFNKKGAGGTFFGMTGQTKMGNLAAAIGAGGRAMYVFFNAAIQGTTNLMHVMRVNPKGTSAGIAAMFLMGALIPFLLDDDDEKDYYDLPEHVRRNHLILPGAGDAWISIPLPIEYRIMYGMGELLTSWRTGHERGEDIARKMLSLSGQALPLNFMEEGLEAFVPSAVSPLWQAYNNRSWTGLPIYKENEFNKYDPEYTKAYSNTDKNLVNFTKALYDWTFDEESQSEGIDLNPAIIETIARGYFSGAFVTASNMSKTLGTVMGDREFDWRNIPIGNRLFKSGDERTKEKRITNEYFENIEKLEFMESRKRMLKKIANGPAVPEEDKQKAKDELREMENSEVYKKYMDFKDKKKQADKTRKKMKDKGASEELEKKLSGLQEEANKLVR